MLSLTIVLQYNIKCYRCSLTSEVMSKHMQSTIPLYSFENIFLANGNYASGILGSLQIHMKMWEDLVFEGFFVSISLAVEREKSVIPCMG